MKLNSKTYQILSVCLLIVLIVGYKFIFAGTENDFEIKGVEIGDQLKIEGEIKSQEKQEEAMQVYICGEVKEEGVFELKRGARVVDLVNLAGGFTDDSDKTRINLARKLEDGEKVVIYSLKEQGLNGDEIVFRSIEDFNYYGVEAFSKLEGIGEQIGKNIVDYRDENGDFENFEDLMNVDGIGEKKLEKILEHVEGQ